MSAESPSEFELEMAHVLFIDLVGYSRLLINEQGELLNELNRLVKSTAQFQSAEAAEKLIRMPTGDGMALAFFSSPEAPVKCALEISEAMKGNSRLKLRMGIHSGPVSGITDVNERSNLAGAGINIAQRVMDCGDAGHILLSKRIADDLGQYGRWRAQLHDLGEVETKHGAKIEVVNLYTTELGNPALPEKFRASGAGAPSRRTSLNGPGAGRLQTRLRAGGAIALAVILIGAAIVFAPRLGKKKTDPAATPQGAASIPQKSIAVLPFENRSEERANAYFADGIQDEILTRLAKIGGLKVISRTSTLHYKSVPEDIPQIAKQLGVATILEGSVQKAGDRVRINVQLISGLTGGHLWAEIYDRKLTDIFTVQSDVATAIASALQTQLTGGERQAVTQSPTGNLAAYDAYLRGLHFANRPGIHFEDRTKAADFFAEAVRLDPDFLPAWARLSRIHSSLYFLQMDASLGRKEAAREAAERAIRLNPSSPDAQLGQAYYRYRIERDYDGARQLFENIRREIPSGSEAPQALALIARRQSRWKDSLALFEETSRLNPQDPALLLEWSWTLSMLRQTAGAHEVIDRALNILPDDPELLASKAALYQMEGDLEAAETLLARLPNVSAADYLVATRFNQFLYERRFGEAVTFLQAVLRMPSERRTVIRGTYRVWLALAQQLAGDHPAALETSRQAADELGTFRQEQPDNSYLVLDLSSALAGLGNKEAALREGERALAMRSAAVDPVVGPILEEGFARIEARCGEIERAIARLERLLTTPYGAYPVTLSLLRIDPTWDPLRGHPRFQQILAGPEPETIYE